MSRGPSAWRLLAELAGVLAGGLWMTASAGVVLAAVRDARPR